MCIFFLTTLVVDWEIFRFGAARECAGVAETPPPHNPDAPIPFCRPASTYESRLWHGARTSPSSQSVQAECSAEHYRRRRRLPQRRQEQPDQHAQTCQGASSLLKLKDLRFYWWVFGGRSVLWQHSRGTRRSCSPFSSSAACGSSTRQASSLTMTRVSRARWNHPCFCATLSDPRTSTTQSQSVGALPPFLGFLAF